LKTLNEYQAFTEEFAEYNEDVWIHYTATSGGVVGAPWSYPTYAIAEEAGEVCGKIAKFIRKSRTSVDTEKLRMDVGKELGDLLFQVSEAARQFKFTLQEIADMNVEKLTDRKERGVLVGEGDDR
jgi:NTP pyrophosphatase (non-canonical NTP hydrolase)